MIDEFIDNFRQKHGFNRQTAMLPYNDEGDSDEEPIELEGGRRMVIRRRIISPDEDTTQEEDPDRLEDLVPRQKKRPAPGPDGGEGESMGPPPGKKPKKAKPGKAPKPKKDPKPRKPKKGKKSKENLTARGDSTGGPPGGGSIDTRAGSSARQRSRTEDCPKAGVYSPL